MKTLKALLLIGSVLTAANSNAAAINLPNAGFENGDLTSWNTIGTVNATPSTSVTTFDSTNWTINAAGTYMAQIYSNGAAVSTIESMLGITAGTLNALNTNPSGGNLTNGAALWQSFSANAGDTISFAWNYVATDYIPFNDPAFALLIGSGGFVDVLASIHGLGDAVGTSGNSGWQTYTASLLGGNYTLAFVTTNDKDTVLDSVLHIDSELGTCEPNCTVSVPEPATIFLISLGFAGMRLRRKLPV